MSWAPVTGWLASMRRTNSSTGGQLEQPSEVKSSRRTGTRLELSGLASGELAARDGERIAGTAESNAARRMERRRTVAYFAKRRHEFGFIAIHLMHSF